MPCDASATDGARIDQMQSNSNIQILIVEDDLEVSRAVAQMATQLGYTPFVCNHPGEVLPYLESHKVDLMLIDYRMPEMTGLDLIFLLRQEMRNFPIVMMTGYAQTESRVSAERLGKFIILKKPITIPQLAKAIEESLKVTSL